MAEDVTGPEMTWMDRLAVEADKALGGSGDKPIVCASGISPTRAEGNAPRSPVGVRQ